MACAVERRPGQAYETSLAPRLLALAAVLLLHVALLAVLISQSAAVRQALLPTLPARLLPPDVQPPLPPPPIRPVLQSPPLLPVPVPEIRVAPPPAAAGAPRAVMRVAPGPVASHFGAAAGDAGLGVDVAASAGGGSAARGSLADFEAAVKRRVLAGKRQPQLAWDRRNTCVVNYTVRVTATGGLGGYAIDPCAVPEINQAARTAIERAAPFPLPPALGGGDTAVHGTLIFRP